ALKSKSNDPLKFGEALLTVMENSKLPLILCSFNPEVLKVGLEMAQDRNPLVYAINESNFSEISELVKKYSLPVVVSSPRNVEKLMKLSGKLMSQGIEDIVLDIGTYPYGKEYAEMLDNLVIIRRLAIEKEVKELGFPILGASSIVWTVKDGIEASFDEACLAASLILRYCDILVMHAFEPLTLLPLLTLRQNIYTDPKKPTSVSPGLYIIGSPDENSPVLITTNFALTYYTVSGDIESGQVSCYLLVADTEGLAVEPALAGGKLNAITVKETIEKSGIENKVKHRKLIIPGVAARIQGEIEDVAKWEVMVGPIDSSRIPNYIRKHWVVE
ncbi:MAG: acetyl-CoA decarbonylase/synthase complex subunit gamma, partial [Candidatus Hydrothermarchaeota archaeon]